MPSQRWTTLFGATVLLLIGCRTSPPRPGPPPAPPAPVPCVVPAAVASAYAEPEGLLVAECPGEDATACLRATLALAEAVGAAGVGLVRGREYIYSEALVLPDGIMVGAVGDPLLPAPILRAPAPLPHASISGGNHVTLYHLDIRGWHYGETHYPVRALNGHEDWQHKGVNFAGNVGWSIIGTSIDGFPGTCVLGVQAEDVLIEDSRLAHCGYSGLSLFQHQGYCGQRITVRNTELRGNGQNGADSCASDALWEGVVAHGNGWDSHTGDNNGLLFYEPSLAITGVVVRGGMMAGNGGDGVRARAASLDVRLEDVTTGRNGRGHIDVPGATLRGHIVCE